ncbi:MAG: hypothetical protein KAS72_07625 [Phycisphaerales bacterium]|nr:hypothetical protein [Phycisphaerales bacterium]
MRQFALRHTTWLAASAAALALTTGASAAETWHSTDASLAPSPPSVVVSHSDEQGIDLTVTAAGVETVPFKTKAGVFTHATWPGAAYTGEAGEPALPIVRELLRVPRGAHVNLTVNAGQATVIDLRDAIVPMQPLVEMRPGALDAAPFVQHHAAYAVNAMQPTVRATIIKAGIARGQQLYQLEVYPIAYNPARGELTVWRDIDVHLTFDGATDWDDSLRPAASLNAVLLNPDPDVRFSKGSGNYLIVVAENLESDIASFASAKTAKGYTVMTYVVPGGSSASSIKSYIEGLWGTADAPEYLLLVGDTNTIPAWSGGGNAHAATDLPYACMDGTSDWYPDMVYGRFSLRTSAELAAITAKSLHLEGGVYDDPDFVKRAAFMAGTDGGSGDEGAHNEVIADHLDPNDYTCFKIYERTYNGTTQDMRNAFNGGVKYGVFYGHSWSDEWQSGPHFSHNDIRNLTNEGMYPVVLSFTCTVGNYASGSYEPCFSEEWIRVAGKGAAGIVATTTYIYYSGNPGWPETAALENYFFDTVYVDGITEFAHAWWGGLWYLLDQYGASDPVCRDYFEMFGLLGDPAMDIPMESGPAFALSLDPDYQNICAPDDATYLVTVHPIMGYSETVTLTVSGEPSGTTTSFSVNPVTPGGSSVLTIGNTAAATPGTYQLLITGTSIDMEKSEPAALQVSNAVPSIPVQVSPADGAMGLSIIPTFTWEAASQALEYELKLGKEGEPTEYYYGLITGTEHTLYFYTLDPLTTYWWRVQANNGCGASGWSDIFTFTTIDQMMYFTQVFTSGFDLDDFSLTFTPNGSGHFYSMCGEAIGALPTDPVGGTTLGMADDGSVSVTPSEGVSLYGTVYGNFSVNANGNITFGGSDSTWQETRAQHFSMPRISAMFDDFNPAAGGTISWKETAELVAVTWQNVPEFNTSNSNTFQIEMFLDGTIRLSWLDVAANDGIVGLSRGTGDPVDYQEMDLSSANPCDDPCAGDLDGDNDVDQADLGILLGAYGVSDVGDLDGDGETGQADLGILLSTYGADCN